MIKILIIALFFVGTSIAEESSCGDWLPFKDEKCFKILDTLMPTYDDAQKSCSILDGAPTLAVVHSQEEQDFLVNYLFKTSKKVNNFWLGAKFTGDGFIWVDNSEFKYNNWNATKGPRNKTGYCLQMMADEASVGKWIGEPCERNNSVVCQKLQSWSMEKLQKTLLDSRKESRDAADESNRKIAQLQHQLDDTKKNPVPIGFIYVQLPKQPDPRKLWSSVKWQDFTTEYKGLFFRAEGGDSAPFEAIQEGNAPRVTTVRYLATYDNSAWVSTTLNIGGWSSGVGVYSGTWNEAQHHTHQFYQSGGEVRPRNMAMRIWKRVN